MIELRSVNILNEVNDIFLPNEIHKRLTLVVWIDQFVDTTSCYAL